MNLTVGRTIPSPWKRIKMQYVALAGGAALAISAVVAFGATDSGSPATSTLSVSQPSFAVPASREYTLTVYLVTSEDEAAAIRQSEAELEALRADSEGPRRMIEVLVAGTPGFDAIGEIEAAWANTPGFEVVDLR